MHHRMLMMHKILGTPGCYLLEGATYSDAHKVSTSAPNPPPCVKSSANIDDSSSRLVAYKISQHQSPSLAQPLPLYQPIFHGHMATQAAKYSLVCPCYAQAASNGRKQEVGTTSIVPHLVRQDGLLHKLLVLACTPHPQLQTAGGAWGQGARSRVQDGGCRAQGARGRVRGAR